MNTRIDKIDIYIGSLLFTSLILIAAMTTQVITTLAYLHNSPVPEVIEYDIVNNRISPTEELIVNHTVTDDVEVVQEEPIDEEELELLAHLIYAEAGSDWCDDSMLYQVGSVVLNRMASEHFPSTMYEVIYQEGQYACTWDGNIEKEPNERAYRIAEDLLRNGSVLPDNVIFQAQFKQGDGVYIKTQNMYFCYIKEEI